MPVAIEGPTNALDGIPGPKGCIPRILVGANGSCGSDGAVTTAAHLIETAHVRVSVVGVVEPKQPENSAARLDVRCDGISARSEMTERLLMQLTRLSPRCVEWQLDVREGDPAAVLSLLAQEQDAGLIITGLGHHDSTRDRFGAETTLRIVRLSRRPVLAVPESFDRALRRAIVATDFSASSLNAAREGLSLFPSLTDVEFVHIAPAISPDMAAVQRWMQPSWRDPALPLNHQRHKALHGRLAFHTTALTGRSVQEILDLAGASGADLIVAGSGGAGLAQRMIVASTASGRLRDVPCALLAVPAAMKRSLTRRSFPAKDSCSGY